MRPTLIPAVLLALFTVTACGKSENKLPAEVEQALASPEKAILFSLEPDNLPAVTHGDLFGFKILGQTKLDAAQTTAAVGAFHAAVSGWDGVMAACFEPRHALRVTSQGHTYDLLLCYGCHQLYIYRDKTLLTSVGAAGSSAVLNHLLTEGKVPLAYAESPEGRAAIGKAGEENDQRRQAELKRWRDAMPPPIRPLWSKDFELSDRPATYNAMKSALVEEYPDLQRRALALFTWYGSGAGSWSGFPSYEDIAEKLLLTMPTPDLVKAAEHDDLTEAQTEGAARLFGGWTFSHQRPDDLNLLSPALKKKLLEHSLKNADDDKRGRAQRAFGK